MKFTVIFFVVSLIGMSKVFSQSFGFDKSPTEAFTDFVSISTHDHSILARIYMGDKAVKTDDKIVYYWYAANEIKSTRGSFAGKLLDGEFQSYFPNRSLREQGQFDKGCKTGKWIKWYPNGEIKEITNWKRSQLHGERKEFAESGKLISRANYREGLLNGRQEILSGPDPKIIEYKNGQPVPQTDRPLNAKKTKETKESKKAKGIKADDETKKAQEPGETPKDDR